MAGINEIEKLIDEKKTHGEVILCGKTPDGEDCLVIKLDDDKGIITQFAYGSDLAIDESIELGSCVNLVQYDDYCGAWINMGKPVLEGGTFSEIIGQTPRNIILECMMECKDIGLGIEYFENETPLSRSTCYNELNSLMNRGFIKKKGTKYFIDDMSLHMTVLKMMFNTFMKATLGA